VTDKIKVVCEHFNKVSDESWISIKVTDILTTDKSIRVNQGIIFRKDRPIWGIDVVKLLEENCAK
jgi:hypothetical protein